RLAHGALQADAAALAAHVDEQARCGLVQMRQVIPRHRDAAAPSEGDRYAGELREHFSDDAHEMRPISLALGLSKRTAPAHQQSTLVVKAEVEQELPRVGEYLTFG